MADGSDGEVVDIIMDSQMRSDKIADDAAAAKLEILTFSPVAPGLLIEWEDWINGLTAQVDGAFGGLLSPKERYRRALFWNYFKMCYASGKHPRNGYFYNDMMAVFEAADCSHIVARSMKDGPVKFAPGEPYFTEIDKSCHCIEVEMAIEIADSKYSCPGGPDNLMDHWRFMIASENFTLDDDFMYEMAQCHAMLKYCLATEGTMVPGCEYGGTKREFVKVMENIQDYTTIWRIIGQSQETLADASKAINFLQPFVDEYDEEHDYGC